VEYSGRVFLSLYIFIFLNGRTRGGPPRLLMKRKIKMMRKTLVP
jgi:hypothetical protein